MAHFGHSACLLPAATGIFWNICVTRDSHGFRILLRLTPCAKPAPPSVPRAGLHSSASCRLWCTKSAVLFPANLVGRRPAGRPQPPPPFRKATRKGNRHVVRVMMVSRCAISQMHVFLRSFWSGHNARSVHVHQAHNDVRGADEDEQYLSMSPRCERDPHEMQEKETSVLLTVLAQLVLILN